MIRGTSGLKLSLHVLCLCVCVCFFVQVSIVSPNSPALYEMHFGIPMAGMVLNTINFRLDATAIAVMLKHCEAKVVFVDVQYLQVVHKALQTVVSSLSSWRRPAIIVVEDRLHVAAAGGESNTWNSFLPGWGELVEYEDLLKSGDPQFAIRLPADDWETISLNYTSGTTARPKGVLYHHRLVPTTTDPFFAASLLLTVLWLQMIILLVFFFTTLGRKGKQIRFHSSLFLDSDDDEASRNKLLTSLFLYPLFLCIRLSAHLSPELKT